MNAQPVKNMPSRPGIDPRLADFDLEPIKALVERAIEHRNSLRLGKIELVHEWSEARAAYNGRQWKIFPGTRLTFEDIVVNKNLWAVDATVAELVNTMPTTTVIPDVSGFVLEKIENAEAVDRIKDDQYDAVRMHEKVEKLVRAAAIDGTSALHDGWDPMRESGSGIGNCTVDVIPAHDLIVDPTVEDHQDGTFCDIRYWYSFDRMKRQWPWVTDDLIEKLVPAEPPEALADAKEITPTPRGVVQNTLAWLRTFNRDKPRAHEQPPDNGAYVHVTYYRLQEYEIQEIPLPLLEEQYPEAMEENKRIISGEILHIAAGEDHRVHLEAHSTAYGELMNMIQQAEAAGQLDPAMLQTAGNLAVHMKAHQAAMESLPWSIQKPVEKWPGGIKLVYAGDLLLEASANETAEHRFPITVVRFFKRPGEFWGMGIYAAWRDIFRLINKGSSQFVEHVNKQVNPKPVIDERMVQEKGDLEGLMNFGTVSVVPPGMAAQGVGWDWMRSVDSLNLATLLQFLDWAERELVQCTRLYPSSLGQAIPSVTSGIQQDQLRESSHSGLSLVEQGVFAALRDTTRNMIVNALRHWTADRKMRRLTKDGRRTSIVYYSPPFIVSDSEGQGQPVPRVPMLEFEIDIVPGSGSRSFRERKQIRALQLFQLGAVDVPYLLSAMDDPDLAEVIKRRDEAAQMGQAVQQLTGELELTEDELRKIYSRLQKSEMQEVLYRQEIAVNQSFRAQLLRILFNLEIDPLQEALEGDEETGEKESKSS